MLSAPHRLTDSADFTAVVRRGARAGRSTLVVHVLLPSSLAGAEPPDSPMPEPSSTRVGFVVPKSVGNSVVRHRVVRRLRPLMSQRLDAVPGGSRVVVRALPPSAQATSANLGADLDGALALAVRRAGVAR